jgi:cytochrome P450
VQSDPAVRRAGEPSAPTLAAMATAQEETLTEKYAEALFSGYRTKTRPGEHRALVRTLATRPSPWYDAARDRWLVFDRRQIRQILTSSSFGNDLTLAGDGTRSQKLLDRLGDREPALLFTDPPLHGTMRRALSPSFGREPVDEIVAGFRTSLARRLLAGVRSGTFDLATVVFPACAEAILDALGFQAADEESLTATIADVFAESMLFDLEAPPNAVVSGLRAKARLRRYVSREIEVQTRAGRGIAAAWAAAAVPLERQVSTLVAMLRAAVVNAGVLLLEAVHLGLEHDVWRRVLDGSVALSRDDLDRLLLAASPVFDTGRVALEPTRVGDVEIPAGSTVITLLAAANVVDVESADAVESPLVFGGGRHVCVGALLVRGELGALVETVRELDRPLVVAGTPRLHATPSFRGIRTLPVRSRRST